MDKEARETVADDLLEKYLAQFRRETRGFLRLGCWFNALSALLIIGVVLGIGTILSNPWWLYRITSIRDTSRLIKFLLNDEPTKQSAYLFLICAVLGGIGYVRKKALHLQAERVRSLDDVRAIGPLLDALKVHHKPTQKTVRTTLVTLLPRLKASDRDLLTSQQRMQLSLLLQEADAELVGAALRALTQVGDNSGVWYVEGLTGLTSQSLMFPLAASPPIREEAHACLEAIQLRSRRQQESRTLLRATQAPEDVSTILLRPAQDAGSTDSARLLRPSINTTDDVENVQETSISEGN